MTPMSSASHQAILALIRVATAAHDEDVQVLDGPTVAQLERDVLAVGTGDPAVMTERSAPDYNGRVTETGEIICAYSSWSGDTDMSERRGRVYDLFAELEAALRANPTLADTDGAPVVDDCYIGDRGELMQRQQKGAIAALGFSVTYIAHI